MDFIFKNYISLDRRDHAVQWQLSYTIMRRYITKQENKAQVTFYN